MSPANQKELKAALHRTQAELKETLTEACDQQDVSDENTGELIRLEELLSDATTAAKEAISLRRRLGAEREKEKGPAEKVREIEDAAGRVWRVWEVPLDQLDRSRPGVYAGEFERGWLCFETADAAERRRLPSYPANWRTIPDAELRTLLAQAKPAARATASVIVGKAPRITRITRICYGVVFRAPRSGRDRSDVVLCIRALVRRSR